MPQSNMKISYPFAFARNRQHKMYYFKSLFFALILCLMSWRRKTDQCDTGHS